jgi:hypothetical protein
MKRYIGLLVVLGCSANPALVDGGAGDGPRGDGASGTARVTVHVRSWTGDGVEEAGAKVESASADGVIVASAVAAADGRATIDGPAGGIVIVTQAGPQKMVIAGVRDGDVLEIGQPALRSAGTASVDFPVEPGAQGYEVATGCGATRSGTPPFDLEVYPACPEVTTIVVTALHGTQPPAYLVAHDVTGFAVDAEISISGTWAAPVAATITITGAPADATAIDVTRSALADGLIMTHDAVRATAIGGSDSHALWAAAGAGERQLVQVDYVRGAGHVFVSEEQPIGDATVEIGAGVPSLTLDAAPGSWTLGGGAADGILYTSAYQDASGAGAIRFVLPPDATHATPPAGVTLLGKASGWIIASSVFGGYDGYRQRGPSTIAITRIPAGFRYAATYF